MAAISHVDLRIDAEAVTDNDPQNIGAASDALPNGAPVFVIVRGNCRNLGAGNPSTLELQVGGTTYSRYAGSPPFGSPAYDALGSPQMAAAFLIPAAGASDEMQCVASDLNSDAIVDSFRAHAFDVSGLTADDQRFHQQGANSNTVADTPTSGFEVLGTPLTVTVPRSGHWIVFASAEFVVDGGAADTDRVHVATSLDDVALSGSIDHSAVGVSGTVRITEGTYFFAGRLADLVEDTEYEIAIQADGTASDGNIGWRRVRIHLFEEAAFGNGGIQYDFDTAGLTVVAGSGAQTVSGLLCTMAPSESTDFLVLGLAQGQFSAWPRLDLRAASTSYPANGAANAAVSTGVGTGDAMAITMACDVIEDVASSTALTMRMEAAAGGVTNLWGTDCVRTDDGTGGGAPEGGEIRLIAIPLYAVDAGGPVDGSFTDTAPADDRVTGESSFVETAPAADLAHGSRIIHGASTREFAYSRGRVT